ncbi:MAG: type secretory pathway, VirB11 component [Pseudomonadota bacterium]|jgi:type IV secretion system protein VirB11
MSRAAVHTTASTATSVDFLMTPLAAWLARPDVLELVVNRPGEVFLETRAGWERHVCAELSLAQCLALAQAVATYSAQQIDATRPVLSATLPGGERVQFVVPPAVGQDTVSITVRKPSQQVWRLADFERSGLFERVVPSSAGRAPHEQALLDLLAERRYAEFFQLAVRTRQTIIVSGQTGSGKTTFMKGLVEEIAPAERLITIEDAAELTLPNHPNCVHLFYSKGGQGVAQVSAKQLLESCLRMKPDRILLAEVRGEECFYFVRVAASGHPGSITSLHAGSCALAFEQMALMIRESGGGSGLELPEIKRLLTLVVDVIVQFGHDAQGRYIQEVYYDPARKQRVALGAAA